MTQESLVRSLTLKDAISLVVGTVIGTGIFLKTAIMSQQTGSPGWVLLAWTAAGILSLVGALTYAELGGLFPRAGGEYVYLRESFGNFFGFLYGWMRFWIASPGSIAAYSVGAVTFLSGIVPVGEHRTLIAIGIAATFTAVNCLSVSVSGSLQSVMTAIKAGLTLLLALSLLFFASGGSWTHLTPESSTAFSASGFGAAMLAALWAFDGWNNLPMAAGEIKDAQTIVPKALVIGIFSVLGLYALINLAYFYALPFTEVLSANSSANPDALPVATKAALTAMGTGGIALISIMMAFSALGALNGSVLTGARVPFAMARDGLFPKALAEVSAKTRVPVTAVIIQGIWASILALSGSFDQLTDYVVFASWIFYAMCTLGVFILRKKMPDTPRPFKTPFYPWLPIIFLIATGLLLTNTLVTAPRESGIGLLLIAAGIPVYFWKFRKQAGLA